MEDKFKYTDIAFTDLELIKSMDANTLKAAGVNVTELNEDLSKALNKQGLVQREITVNGKNGTYTRKQWMKVSDAAKLDTTQSGKKVGADDTKDTSEQAKITEGMASLREKGKAHTKDIAVFHGMFAEAKKQGVKVSEGKLPADNNGKGFEIVLDRKVPNKGKNYKPGPADDAKSEADYKADSIKMENLTRQEQVSVKSGIKSLEKNGRTSVPNAKVYQVLVAETEKMGMKISEGKSSRINSGLEVKLLRGGEKEGNENQGGQRATNNTKLDSLDDSQQDEIEGALFDHLEEKYDGDEKKIAKDMERIMGGFGKDVPEEILGDIELTEFPR